MLGHLSIEPMPSVLRHMYTHHKTGDLVVRQESMMCRLHLDQGNILKVMSDDPEYLFGSHLLKHNLISREELTDALSRTREDLPLGQVLIRERNHPSDMILGALVDLHAMILSKTLVLTEGAYMLNVDGMNARVAPVTTNANLIFHSCRYLEDERMMLDILGGADLYLIFSKDPFLLFQNIMLHPEEYFFISRLQDFTRVEDYLRLYPQNRNVIIRMLFGLVSAGVLELVRKDEALEIQFNREESGKSALELMNLYTEEASSESDGFLDRVKEMHERVKSENFYGALGLPKATTQREIREKYHELAKTFHPDQAQRLNCLEVKPMLVTITSVLRDAHETLSFPEKKSLYDRELAGEKSQSSSVKSSGRRSIQLEIAEQNYLRAQDLLAEGENYLAYELLSQAIRFQPKNRDYLIAVTKMEIQNPRWLHRAVRRLMEYVEEHAKDAEILEMLGDLFAEKSMKKKAADCYQKALKVRENDRRLQKKIREMSK